MKQTVLYVDDEDDNLTVFKSLFRQDYNVITTHDPKQGLFYLKETTIDLVISDYKMPNINGIDLLATISLDFPDTTRILLSAYSDLEIAIKSINKSRVFAYVQKPWNKDEFQLVLEAGLKYANLKKQNKNLINELREANSNLQNSLLKNEEFRIKLEMQNKYLKSEIEQIKDFNSMVGSSAYLNEIKGKIEKVSMVDTTVLIEGSTGTGKELVARCIHNLSMRREKPFIKVNCAALQISLVESELFGHEKGSFTGAHVSKLGFFELAHEGTIFLDEIGEMPFEIQPKLLRVLQEGEFYRVGGSKPIKVDVRVLAATNRILIDEVRKGKFRADLFYRINIFSIRIPALKERKEDIPILVEHLLKKYQRKLGITITNIPKNTLHTLVNHSWPGNIRELEAIIERSMISSENGSLTVSIDASFEALDESDREKNLVSLQEMEKGYITRVLTKTNWRISGENGAAAILKINHNTLRTKMSKLGINFKKLGE